MKLCTLHFTFGCVLLSSCALAAFKMDRSVMSDAYWKIWNDDVQAKIDADIEKYRKADASVEVAAPDGTEVTVDQESHAFFFGVYGYGQACDHGSQYYYSNQFHRISSLFDYNPGRG